MLPYTIVRMWYLYEYSARCDLGDRCVYILLAIGKCHTVVRLA